MRSDGSSRVNTRTASCAHSSGKNQIPPEPARGPTNKRATHLKSSSENPARRRQVLRLKSVRAGRCASSSVPELIIHPLLVTVPPLPIFDPTFADEFFDEQRAPLSAMYSNHNVCIRAASPPRHLNRRLAPELTYDRCWKASK